MSKTDDMEIDKEIQDKYQELGENPAVYLQGLLHSKPLTYWDYIETDTLLSLQRPRTHFPDEMIFILYHQLTEILLKLMRHELEQICTSTDIESGLFLEKINRVNRYLGICINSFDVMGKGMDPEQYDQFRTSLTPASGFQSAQFRMLELMSTDIHNLLINREKENLKDIECLDCLFENLYWQEAGKNRKTGEKTLMLNLFEEKYLSQLKDLALTHRDKNVWQQFVKLEQSASEDLGDLKEALKQMDRYFNIEWPLVHLRTAEAYLEHKQGVKAATGGSDWKKYLHPKYQRRIFFPELLTSEENANWGT